MMYNEPKPSDKIVPIVCGIIFATFLAYTPFMVADANKRKEQKWQEQGCQMYDGFKASDVPAKCSNYFTDHYKPQTPRTQPPEES